jgi:hypothetical protein
MNGVKDRHVIMALLIITALALSAGCESEVERERGRYIMMCLKKHSPEECALLFPPSCRTRVEVETGE